MVKLKKYNYDLIVIGSGAGGGVAANLAAARGKKVAIIEKEAIGGECPNWACVPTKALLHAAERYELVKSAGDYGINTGKVSYDYKKIRAWKDLVVSRTGAGDTGEEIFRDAGIDVIMGAAHFISPKEVAVDGKRLSAKRFLIATGTSNFIPPVSGLEKCGFITFREAIDLKSPPKSLFIIGGGPIGCEFAQLFSTFDTEVTIADMMPKLLANEEPEVGELVEAVFENRGIKVLTECRVVHVEKQGRKKVVHYKLGDLDRSATVDEILVASGKRPNTDIGLENAGVEYNKRGIITKTTMQTTADHIYAAGDVVGPYQFTHTASYQSRIAGHNMFSRKRKLHAKYSAIPRTTFVSPEVASVGITTAEARAKGQRVKIGAVPLEIIGRSNTSDDSIGFVKVITDTDGIIIGGAVVASRAGEMIHELALAVRLRVTVDEVVDTVHAFPTYSEAVRMACAAVK